MTSRGLMLPVLERLDHVHVFVTDRTAAEAWYRDVLDLRRDPALAFWSSGGGPLMLKNPSRTIMLAVFERPPQISRSTIAFQVQADQFLLWISHLEKSSNRKIDAVDHQVCWSTYFVDPDENPFEITCYDYDILANALKA